MKNCLTCDKPYNHAVWEKRLYCSVKCSSIAKAKNMIAKKADEFVARGRALHGDRYGYSAVEYVNSRCKVKIIMNKSCGKTFGQLYDETMLRLSRIEQLGYRTQFVWESAWQNAN